MPGLLSSTVLTFFSLLCSSEATYLRLRPPTTIPGCKECHQQKLDALGSLTNQQSRSSSSNEITDNNENAIEAEEGLVAMNGNNRPKNGRTEVSKSLTSLTTTGQSSSPDRSAEAISTGPPHHLSSLHSTKGGNGTPNDSNNGSGGGSGSSSGSDGSASKSSAPNAFASCKPWLGDKDPCQPKPFVPVNLLPPASTLAGLPGASIASPIMAKAKPLMEKALQDAKDLGKQEHDHAQEIIDKKKIERDTVSKALEDLSMEKKARIANGEPPPGLIPNENEGSGEEEDGTADSPCPVDASGN